MDMGDDPAYPDSSDDEDVVVVHAAAAVPLAAVHLAQNKVF